MSPQTISETVGGTYPHELLLTLLALGRWANGKRQTLQYTDVEVPLRDLLTEFGSPRRSHHPEFPSTIVQSICVAKPVLRPPLLKEIGFSCRLWRSFGYDNAGSVGERLPPKTTAASPPSIFLVRRRDQRWQRNCMWGTCRSRRPRMSFARHSDSTEL